MPQIGDLVGFFNAGAYGFTMSMLYFLGHPLPAEVVVLEGGGALARARGEVGDCLVGQLDVAESLWCPVPEPSDADMEEAASPVRVGG